MRYAIQKLGRDFKSIVLKLTSDQIISLRIINENQDSTACEILIVDTEIQNVNVVLNHQLYSK